MIKLNNIKKHVSGYPALTDGQCNLSLVSSIYLERQHVKHKKKVIQFLLPLLEDSLCDKILDVGCGVGMMVKTLIDMGYDAYGVDLMPMVESWAANKLPHDKFYIVDPYALTLPFDDGGMDFVYSLGVIEHIGTVDGHSDRLENYHELRKQWIREVFRVIRRGGLLLIGGPNRKFPIDTHGPDSRASKIEKWLYKTFRLSIHKVWGDHFLWSYKDISRYLDGYSYDLEPLSMRNYYEYKKNTPKLIRPFFKFYVENIPTSLLRTGFNPWVMALIRKT